MPHVEVQRDGSADRPPSLSTLAFPALGIALIAILALTRRSDVVTTAGVLGDVTLLPFALAVVFSLLGMASRAAQYRSAHQLAGVDTSLRSMARVSAAGYALNKVVKTGGMGGIALFIRHGTRQGRPGASILAACLLSSISGYLAMVAITGIALVWLATSGTIGGPWLPTVIALGTVALVALPAVGIIGLRSRSWIKRGYRGASTLVGRVAERFGRPGPGQPDDDHVDRFYDAIATLRRNPGASLPVLGHALAAKLLGAAILAASLESVGADVGVTTAVAIYALALLAAAASVLPGGIGAVEATMTVLLTSHGVPTSTALAATLAFRLLDMWLPILIGLIAVIGLDRSPSPKSVGADERLHAIPACTDSLCWCGHQVGGAIGVRVPAVLAASP